MKKIYKSPEILVVNIRTNHMLAESIVSDDTQIINNESDGGWVKEQNTFPNGSVWDNEW